MNYPQNDDDDSDDDDDDDNNYYSGAFHLFVCSGICLNCHHYLDHEGD